MNILEEFRYKTFSHNEKVDILVKEIFRKSIHMTSAAVPFFAEIWYLPTIIFIFICAIFYCMCEFLRWYGYRIPFISAVTNMASRKRDDGKFVLGPITLCAGIILSLLLFPMQAAKAAILSLAFGDGIASLAGKAFGNVRLSFSKDKTLAGSSACFSAVFISIFILSGSAAKACITAFAASVSEALPFKNLDNIIIPLIAGSVFALILI